MPRNARFVLPGLAHHVTQRGNNRQTVFFSPEDRDLYLNLVRDNLIDAGVRVMAYCLMSNHVHWIVLPERGDSLAVLFRRAHGRYAQYLNTRRRQSGHLWQARYFSCALAPAHLDTALRYVEQNPVRAAMVQQPADYPWSSATTHLSEQPPIDPLWDLPFWRERGSAAGWRQLLEKPDRPALIHMLRRCTFAERPFGNESFLQQIEAVTSRRWRRSTYTSELRDSQVELRLEALAASVQFTTAAGPDRNIATPAGAHHA